MASGLSMFRGCCVFVDLWTSVCPGAQVFGCVWLMVSSVADFDLLVASVSVSLRAWRVIMPRLLSVLRLPPTRPAAPLLAVLCAWLAGLLLRGWWSRRRLQGLIAWAREQRALREVRAQEALEHFGAQHPEVQAESILALPLTQLREQLQEGSLSPEHVFFSYLGQALRAHRKLNCLTDIVPWEGQLRELQQRTDKGFLHGVPVSLKDNLNCKGLDTSCGVVKRLGAPAQEDCVLVKVLKSQGALPFLKTNVPQSMLSFDSSNPIFGRTLHPQSPDKSPGGSSSGEAVLIAAGGSPVGLGTDLGGSIRVPAAFCGLCGLKPTSSRLSSKGVVKALNGQSIVTPAVGPLARDVDSLALLLRALLCEHMFRLDPTVTPLPFNQELYSSRGALRIGYYECDGFSQPTPSMLRALRHACHLLQGAGHQLVPFSVPRMDYAMIQLFLGGLSADGQESLYLVLKDEPVDPAMQALFRLSSYPRLLKQMLSLLWMLWCPRRARMLRVSCGVGSVRAYWEHQGALKEYQCEFMDQWLALRLDVLLCPCPGPAPNIHCKGQIGLSSYTCLYNVLDFPAGSVPVGLVTEQDEQELQQYRGCYQDMLDRAIPRVYQGGVGLPVSVQCVALPWQEELCLRVMKEVETLVQRSGR